MYEEFGEIINTMKFNSYDYTENITITLNALNDRKNGKNYSLSDHICSMVFALLSNQRPWKHIADNQEKIKTLFNNFDVDFIKKTDYQDFVDGLLALHCGNRQIRKQMQSLKDNIETLERIAKDYGSVDNYYNNTNIKELLKSLSGGKYKLKQLGVPLVSEYLKGVGMDVIKPDVHVCRILTRLGYSKSNKITDDEAFDICCDIAKEYNISNVEVDSILWQYCAKNYFEVCCDKPKCSKCKVSNCKSRQAKYSQLL